MQEQQQSNQVAANHSDSFDQRLITWESDSGSHLLELRRLPCEATRADAGAILVKWNSVQSHDHGDSGLPNISRQGQGLWTHESIQDPEAATLLPHRVLTVSEAYGLVVDVRVYNLAEIEDKAAELFKDCNVIGSLRIRRCACSLYVWQFVEPPPHPSKIFDRSALKWSPPLSLHHLG